MGVVYNHVTTLIIWKNSTAEDNITKFCTLLESKRPTKFDPKVGVAYDHVTTFEISGKTPISQEWLKL